jgi:hypothetical protein
MSQGFSDSDMPQAETMQGRTWPCLRQFCVFLENRVGRLNDLMRQVESLDTRVLAMSFVDSVDFAMVRLMFNDADRARERLELSGFQFSESDVVGVELPEGDKPFHEVCAALMKAEINIHHAYPLLYRRRGRGAVAMFVDDVDNALNVLKAAGHRVITENDLLDDDEYL